MRYALLSLMLAIALLLTLSWVLPPHMVDGTVATRGHDGGWGGEVPVSLGDSGAHGHGVAHAARRVALTTGGDAAPVARSMHVSGAAHTATTTAERKRVFTASVSLVARDLGKLAHDVEEVAEQNGGFLVSSSKRGDYHLDMQLRVRADTLKESLRVLTEVGGNIVAVDHASQNGQDITDQYEDNEARIRVYNATRETLMQLFKNATNVQDVLQVQQQLTMVNQQLDILQGQKKRMDGDVSFSLITLSARKFQDHIVVVFWSPAQVFAQAIDALLHMFRRMASALIYLAVFSPVLLILSILIWLVVRFIARRLL